MKIASILLSLLAFAGAAQAQTPMPRIEFDEAVRRAIEQNPSVAQAVTGIARAESLLQQSRAVNMPFVNATSRTPPSTRARGFAGGVTQPQSQVAFSGNVSIQLSGAHGPP